MDGKNRLRVIYSNVQSLNNKVNELRAIANMESPDVIALTETWTNENITDAYLQLEGYELLARKDRTDTSRGRGGGIVVYVRGMHVWEEEVDTEFNQCVTIRIKRQTGECALHVVYRSPNSSRDNDDKLCGWIKSRCEKNKENVFVGDFNFPSIDWAAGTSDIKGRAFYDACMDSFLVQHVDQGTHRSGHILDLVLTSDETMAEKVRMIGKLGSSDHEMMMVELNVGVVREEIEKRIKDYGGGKYGEMRKMMDIDWKRELDGRNVEEMWNEIERRINEAVKKWVPEKKIKSKGKPRWMTNEILKLIREKRNAREKWKNTRSEGDKNKYKALEAKTKKTIRNKKNALERKIAKTAKENPKAFFSYLNSQKKTRTKIGPLKDEDGDIVTDTWKQAEIFNSHYASVFTRSTTPSPEIRDITEEKLEDVEITVEEVKNLIDGLKEDASPGPDEISNRVLKELKDELALPLQILFRKSLDDGHVPEGWKESVVSPIYKKGEKSAPVNYRPVNLTSNVCKLMERVLKKQMEEHLEKTFLKTRNTGSGVGGHRRRILLSLWTKSRGGLMKEKAWMSSISI